MTVGVGFQCSGGVVLCADSQINKSGGLKYNEKKIYTLNAVHPSRPDYYGVTLCYAGDPDIMKLLCERIENLYQETIAPEDWDETGIVWNDMFSGEVEKKIRELYKTHSSKEQQLELLYAIYSQDAGVSLYRAQGRVVRSSDRAECIGVGDSSVLRYLADLFVTADITIPQALTLGCYMVAKAGTYIAGCGGPTQAFFMTHNGKYKTTENSYDNLESAERAVKKLLCLLTTAGIAPQARSEAFQEFQKSISYADINWPRDYFNEKLKP